MAGRLAHQLGDAKSVAILLERGVAMAGSPKMCAEPTAKYGIIWKYIRNYNIYNEL